MVVRDINTRVLVRNMNTQVKYRYLKKLFKCSQKVFVLTSQSISTTNIYTRIYIYILYISTYSINITCITMQKLWMDPKRFCALFCSCDGCNSNLPSYLARDLLKIGLHGKKKRKMFSVKNPEGQHGLQL